ncbi:MAG: thiamine phosphate synthase [Deltaproteobacteria bacterium]|nr:thiamine phosphate synthase [Deltaproteobacteria bacterium]
MKRPSARYQQRLTQFIEQVTVYPVSCEKLACGRSDEEWLEAVLAGGARIVQLRDKLSDDRTVYEKALLFRRKTAEAGALFIINNRVDIALLAEADGVHLGNSDLPARAVRELAPDLLIGVSANTKDQAASARERGASYYNIGPLFKTATKSGLLEFIGEKGISDYSGESDLPFTVMGGIKLEHVQRLTALGASRIAVVTALTRAEDIAEETKRWIEAINRGKEAGRSGI